MATRGLALVPGDGRCRRTWTDALTRPEIYWDAVLQTRGHLGAPPLLCAAVRGTRRLCRRPRRRRGAARVNILFVMKHRGNAGNTHAVANYMRVAPKHGHSVAIYGTPIWYVPELQFSTDITRLRPGRLRVRVGALPHQDAAGGGDAGARSRGSNRLILDTDGMYNPVVVIDGYDFNHRNEAERGRWLAYFDALGDRDHADNARRARPIRGRQRHDVLRLQPGSAGRPGRGPAEAVRHPACRP